MSDIIEVPAVFGRNRFWRNTSVAKLKPGEIALLEGANLGHEWDEDLDNGFRPAGIQHLSETTVTVSSTSRIGDRPTTAARRRTT